MVARTRYAPDRGLTARMTATMFLLGLVFVAFVAAIVFILSAVQASGALIVLAAVVIGGGLAIGSLFYSDKIALSTAGAQIVTPQQAPELHGVVDRICALADMPKPRIAISPTDIPNAFATGRNTKHVRPLRDRRPAAPTEPRGTRGCDRARAVARGAQGRHGDDGRLLPRHHRRPADQVLVLRGALRRGGRRNSNDQNSGLILLAILAVSIVVYAISFLLIRLLSRYRELAADRSGALLTGQPSALSSALQKVSGTIARIPTKDLREAQPLNAFFFVPALSARDAETKIAELFSTHPSLEKRQAQLAKISAQLSRQQ